MFPHFIRFQGNLSCRGKTLEYLGRLCGPINCFVLLEQYMLDRGVIGQDNEPGDSAWFFHKVDQRFEKAQADLRDDSQVCCHFVKTLAEPSILLH